MAQIQNGLPEGFVLLQRENGKDKYAACMTGRFAGWLMWKHPDGQWVSQRKLEQWEIMQVEDQRDDGVVHETSTPAPAMGEELPPPKYPKMRMLSYGDLSECAGYTADQMLAYGRACMALRQPATAVAVGVEPIMFGGRPVESMQIDLLCMCLKEHTMFDGPRLEKAWNDLVQFYMTNRRTAPPAPVAVPDIKDMVNRFLGWKLPKTFNPDCGISFKPLEAAGGSWPIGTNMLTADEAKAMFEHCVRSAIPSAPVGGS